MSLGRLRRRRPFLVLAAIALVLGLTGTTSAHASTRPPSATGQVVIRSGQLAVTVDRGFPTVRGYDWRATGAHLGGAAGTPDHLEINGAAYRPAVRSTVGYAWVDYHLQVPELGVRIQARLGVRGNILTFAVTHVDDPNKKLSTLAFPGDAIVSASSDQPAAQMSSALLAPTYYVTGPSLDSFTRLAGAPVQTAPKKATVAFLNTANIAAGVSSNALQSFGNLLHKTTASGSGTTTGIWSDTWTYRGPDGAIVALPREQVALATDRNADGNVDWQDGAIAYRAIMPVPHGAAQTKNNVVSDIAFNISSAATHPFPRTLDDIKKTYLATDGLGQSIQLKGYQDQGHDTAHPDYAGDYNLAAGGLPDMRYLVDHAGSYNARIGVHINEREEHLAAKHFRWSLASDPSTPFYCWLDCSWSVNQPKDTASGDFTRRIDALKRQVPRLSWVYVDAYFDTDWDAYKVATSINHLGWGMYTEFPDYAWPYVLWYHNTNEYGDQGVNSTIMRFLYNSDTDTWVGNASPILKGERNTGFMGWHGQNDFDASTRQVFTTNLPTKWLQHFQITRWSGHSIDFTGGVHATDASGSPRVYSDGHLVEDGNDLFLPWDPRYPGKIYAWSGSGNPRSWYLPKRWDFLNRVQVYRLTDTGRHYVSRVPVHNGQVRLRLSKDTPYVVTPVRTIFDRPVKFGAGGPVADPEFYSHTLAHWHRSGDVAGAQIVNDSNGLQDLQIAGAGATDVSQRIAHLRPGTYSASAWVTVAGHRRAELAVTGADAPAANTIDRPPPVQLQPANPRFKQNFERIKVIFTVGRSGRTVTIHLRGGAAPPDGSVRFADVRVVRDPGADIHAGGATYTEDFEHVDQGWGPFVYGLGDSSDPSVHLSRRHSGYTRDTISGVYSLDTMDHGKGIVYRTWPGTVNFKPGHRYRVSLDYQADTDAEYQLVVGQDGAAQTSSSTPFARTTDRPLESAPPAGVPRPPGWTDTLPPQPSAPHAHLAKTFTAGTGAPYFLGVHENGGGGELTMDNLRIEDLGWVSSVGQ